MRANMPRSFSRLCPAEKERINQAIFDRLDEELCDAQITWIKMACAILHDVGLTREQITMFVGGWKNMYRKNARVKNKQEQTDFLNARLSAVFGAEGFPEEWVQALREIGRDEHGRYKQ